MTSPDRFSTGKAIIVFHGSYPLRNELLRRYTPITFDPLHVGRIQTACQEKKDKADVSINQGIGAAQDAARMQRVVSFYEALPRGPAPEVKPRGLFNRYQARYFGKNPSPAREFEL